jgi:hypothetical protein
MSGYICWQSWTLTDPRTFLFGLGMVAIALTFCWFTFAIRSFNLVERGNSFMGVLWVLPHCAPKVSSMKLNKPTPNFNYATSTL